MKKQNATIYVMASEVAVLKKIIFEEAPLNKARHSEFLLAEAKKTRSQIADDSTIFDGLIAELKSENR